MIRYVLIGYWENYWKDNFSLSYPTINLIEFIQILKKMAV
jgi:hypothetical protein